jgi:S-phase kinase-associated protein 1
MEPTAIAAKKSAPDLGDEDIDVADNKSGDAEKKSEEEDGGFTIEDGTLTLISGPPDKKKFEIDKKSASLSEFVTTILKGDADATEIEAPQVPAETLKLLVEYLKEHKGIKPDDIPQPIKSVQMSANCSHPWDAEWIDKFDQKTIFEIILAANYLDIKPLLHLGCAKTAAIIKQLDPKEINSIIEAEEKSRRELEATEQPQGKDQIGPDDAAEKPPKDKSELKVEEE